MTASNTPKPPTAQGVSAALRTAGFGRSEPVLTGIRGWKAESEGYRVRRWGREDAEVRVEHTTGSGIGPDDRARSNAKLTEYSEALEAKGWVVRRIETGTPCLLVTMKVEEG